MSQESKSNNHIIESILSIDKIQKEVLIEEKLCVSCDTSLLAKEYDTIPVSFLSHDAHPFCANIGVSKKRTTFFRIESVRHQRYAKLRLLEAVKRHKSHEHKSHEDEEEFVLVGTEFTCILDLNDIGLIECYEPINVHPCRKC